MTGRIPAEVTEAAGSQVRWPLALTGLGQAIPLARATAEAAEWPVPPQGMAGKCAARLTWLGQQYALSRGGAAMSAFPKTRTAAALAPHPPAAT
jgi:hypothetical protein